MNKGELIKALNDFVEQQDDDTRGEYYETDKERADEVMQRFRIWLIDSKLL